MGIPGTRSSLGVPVQSDETRYCVIGIRRNGAREVCAENLTFATAESAKDGAEDSGLFVRVVIEAQTGTNGDNKRGTISLLSIHPP